MKNLLTLVFSLGYTASTLATAADTVLTNATIYTMDPNTPSASEIGFNDKRIVCLGDIGACDRYRSAKTSVTDLQQRAVLPGFIDSHNHISDNQGSKFLSVFNAANREEFRATVKAFSDENPDLSWIMGDGWNYSLFEGGMPTAKDLEGITGGRPAIFSSYDAHTELINVEAMAALTITRDTKTSALGEIVRDASGNPTGVFKSVATVSDADQAHLDATLPAPDAEDVYQVFIQNLRRATTLGITTIVEPQVTPEVIESFVRANKEGQLHALIRLALYYPNDTSNDQIEQYVKIRDQYANNSRINVPAIKLYLDDVIEAQTAALFEPYAMSDSNGSLFFAPSQFATIVTELDARKFQLFIHAIGDRGVNTALNALESAYNANGKPVVPHQIIHAELIKPNDLPRFAKLNVSASMQPRHLAPDITEQWAKNVGTHRHNNAWPFQSLLDNGARLALGSDWNVAEMNPLLGIYTAVTRQSLDGDVQSAWQPQQKITVQAAVEGYTINGAISNGIEANRGSLVIGKMADVVVLSDNIFEIAADDIKGAQVLRTYFEGELVYTR